MADDDIPNAVSAYSDTSKSMAERVGLRNVPPPAKPDPKDYGDLFEDVGKSTQVAGPAAGATARPKVKDYADLFEETKPDSETKATPAERVGGGFEDVAKQSNPISEFYTRTQSGEDIGSAALHTLSSFNQQHPYAAPIAGGLAGLVTAAALPEGAIAAGAAGTGMALRGAYRVARPYLKGYAMAKGAEMALGPELGGKIGALLESLIH